MDHINKLTQIEDPREQWRREQERMLKEYLIVAQEALNAKKEIYQIKQQRFELAQEEYQQLHKLCEDDSRSYASSFSGYSTNTKYDPHQIKAEIASRRDRLSRLKRELTQMKQELQYKEKGVETLQEIDRKMSSAHTNYKLDEAQAIMSELRTIKKAICTGEKERRDLMQSLAKLTDSFKNSCSITDSIQDFSHSAGALGDSGVPQQFCDAGSQTDTMGEFVFDDKTRLVDRVRLNWQYEEARKRVANIQQQLAQLANESWPGMAEADRDRLQLIKEKEALLQELQLIIQQRRSAEDVARLEEEKRRLEEEIQRARATSAQGATERILLQEKRNCLLMQLEEATRLTSYLQSQLKSLSASTLTVSSGSSRGSLASSRGSLASSRGSLSSVSFTDIYGLPQYEKADAECGQLLHFDLIPFDSLGRDVPFSDPPGHPGFHKQRRSLDTPQSLASLSSRSSLSSLSPPSSPLDTPFLPASRDSPLAQLADGFEVPGLGALDRLRAQASALGDEDLQGTALLQPHGFSGDGEGPRERGPQLVGAPTNTSKWAQMNLGHPMRGGTGWLMDNPPQPDATQCYGDLPRIHGPAHRDLRLGLRRNRPDPPFPLDMGVQWYAWPPSTGCHDTHFLSSCDNKKCLQTLQMSPGDKVGQKSPSVDGHCCSPVRGTFPLWGICGPQTLALFSRHDSASECLLVHVLQLRNFAGLVMKEDCKIHVRVYLPPLDSGTPNTYCSKALEFQAPLVFNEVFRIPVHSSMLTLKSLQLYVCSVNPQLQEELLGIAQINLAECDSSGDMQLRWYPVQVFASSEPPRWRENGRAGESVSRDPGHASLGKTDAVTVLLARTTAQLQAVERELAEERVKLEYTEEEILEMERKEEQAEAISERSWQADSVDSGCSNCTQTSPPYPDPCCVSVNSIHGHTFTGQADPYSSEKLQPPPLKVDKETNTEDLFPEEAVSILKERPSRRTRGTPFVRSSTIVRSQTFSPGARSQYVCRLYRSDSDSSTLPRKSPFVRNTLERRTLRYKQSCRSSLAELMARTSLDLELDLQASRTRQRQLNEEICALRELRQRLEDAQLRGQTDLPHWVLRDERFRSLLKEAERQTRQTKLDYHQEQAAEKMLKKASKEIYQLRGQNHKEPIQVQTFREKIAFFTRPRINIPPLPADDV
ncbi:protein WWC3-like [Marmota marmota marmota]|uniref:protein WWC3-like n=1 Tax=Marmota marmota marmota TaxID=9994 RepID=UPI00076226A7|nr:protein WWC3-like [Marmota marmota marmota]